ncbi:MAG: hypothetical protein Kow0062_10380 [Acidobacteriota bacterium]
MLPALAAAPAPARICSVSLAGDEFLALLVPTDRVVCVSAWADDEATSNVRGFYPERVLRVTAHVEPVLGQRPDLVLAAPWNSGEFLAQVRRSGIPVHVMRPVADLDEMRAEIRDLGRLLGVPDEARALIERLDRRVAALRAVVGRARGPKPRVLSFSHLVVAGENTSVDTLIGLAGGINAAREIGVSGHRKVSLEAIVALDPDVLLLGFEPGRAAGDVLAAYPPLAATRAAREGRVVLLAPRLLTTVTPHLVEGARRLAEALHPELAPIALDDGR